MRCSGVTETERQVSGIAFALILRAGKAVGMARRSPRGVAVACSSPGHANTADAIARHAVAAQRQLPFTATQNDQLRGIILEGLQLTGAAEAEGGKAFHPFQTVGKAGESGAAKSGKTLCNQLVNKCVDLPSCLFRYPFGTGADLPEKIICRVLPVKKLPQVNACRAQAETMTGIGVEENGPIVELLPEHDNRVRNRLFTV